ncbi:N-acetylmuramoyl-L-alanine amidase [Vibrio maritimus]|uniref:N-acetylmuramoyl-L-alanine amidase n=1 Tax=Vibrio maritimus TaxID=990268 RepID=A0A090S9R1_9VIBR|nr:N-acetylmuramoyl-L-alanine amidase [Vibrio maritimus]
MISRFLSSMMKVMLPLCLLFPAVTLANALEGIRVWPSPDETRVVIDLKSEADYSYFSLTGPSRIVVDLKNTSLNTKLPIGVSDSPVLSKIRKSSPPNKGTYRLVFELKKSSTPQIFKLNPTPGGQYGHRLVIDLPHGKATSNLLSAHQAVKPK